MKRRNHKSFVLLLLAFFCVGGMCLYIAGCSDNPEAKAAKEMRNQTADAVQKSVTEKDYGSAQEKMMALLARNRSVGLTKDAALLASGNLALAKGQQMQSDLGLQTLPLRADMDELERILRRSGNLVIEKEKIEKLLQSGDDEIAELQQLLDGDDQKEGLEKQLEVADTQMEQLLSKKDLIQTGKDQTQAILDEYQSKADTLLRQAELAKGDQRLNLEKQAFDILKQRKDYYTKVQSADNELAVLDSDITLVQVRVDGLTQGIQGIQQRIESIDTSQVRAGLKQQVAEVEKDISDKQKQLAEISRKANTGLTAYRNMADEICAVYDEAISEFNKIYSGDADFTATARLADSTHYAALTCATFIKTQRYLAERLRVLMDVTDPEFLSIIQNELRIQQDIDTDYANKTFAYFDQSIEAYEKALSVIMGLSRNLKSPEDKSKVQEAECSLMKSELLAMHSKMQLADLTEAFDLANSTETTIDELVQKGAELGVCFTQSEVIRIIENEGLNYFPSLPLNMEVFFDGKKQELSAWENLPLDQQEAVIDDSLQEIDELIAKYGEDVASQLEPLKQEMLAAKERGFEESAPSSAPDDPNSYF